LRFIFEAIAELGLQSAQLAIDVTLARGLNYYTGAIFEVAAKESLAALKLTTVLRKAGIKADLYPTKTKIQKQFKYANNRKAFKGTGSSQIKVW